MKVILLSGKAEHGKTTSANLLQEQLEEAGYSVVRLSYGDYVKETAKKIFGWNGQKDAAGRNLLQWWGTDEVRAKHPDFWAETVKRLADVIGDLFDYLIIDDVRYPNEIECWTGYEIFPIRIEHPNYENALIPEQRLHPSETSLDNWPFEIRVSARDIYELEIAVDKIIIPAVIR